MATIKPIDSRSIHQIQSGQVIVDLCSVVKELVENSIDSSANIIDVRFRDQGLGSIEVQDNGSGISPANYASIALKHHTSKLSTYSDIASLQTFGFRGEALASLCALSCLTVTTCLSGDAPKGTRLSFEPSGKLEGTSVVAAQKGTTVSVERLFHNLPVRRRELERNIKREWHKVVALLNQYACIQTKVKFSISQQPTKGKRLMLFSTNGNLTTRDNIINIFGAKTMAALVSLDLTLEMQPSADGSAPQVFTGPKPTSKEVRIVGHISRPVHGEGRQIPDRQMFFVNGRPCGLPQFAKVFNEVYKGYNHSQSPFVFADIQLDTHMYDVNVSPDKRSILLHDQHRLLDNLRTTLTTMFDAHDQTIPVCHSSAQIHNPTSDRPALKRSGEHNLSEDVVESGTEDEDAQSAVSRPMGSSTVTLHQWITKSRHDKPPSIEQSPPRKSLRSPLLDNPNEADETASSSSLEDNSEETEEDSGLLQHVSADLVPHKMIHSVTASIPISTSPSPQKGKAAMPTHKILRADHDTYKKSSLDTGSLKRFLAGSIATNPIEKQSPDNSTGHFSGETEDRASDADTTASRENSTSPSVSLPISVQNSVISELGQSEDKGSLPQQNSAAEIGEDASDEIYSTENQKEVEPTVHLFHSGSRRKDGIAQVVQLLHITEDSLRSSMKRVRAMPQKDTTTSRPIQIQDIAAPDAESKLSLIISKNDFSAMRVAGQFNLGFIIAVRLGRQMQESIQAAECDELFIIDQHASDEKYNFEKLQETTVVQSQRLVHPKRLQLTALEEEILIENMAAIEANGFKIEIDTTQDWPVGSRCQLLALPLSRETTFGLEDLEELISLLADESSGTSNIPRPSKVRKMFAMRACRSSVMIGKALTRRQMTTLVQHMGQLDKPWNCPHGRPTMRHLCRLQTWDNRTWTGDSNSSPIPWRSYVG